MPFWLDQSALKAWCLDNLDRYWQRLLDRAGVTASLSSLAALTPYAAVWVVPGVSRIHYTLATGEICSKDAAGRYARDTFPAKWERIIDECMRIRSGERVTPLHWTPLSPPTRRPRVWRDGHR